MVRKIPRGGAGVRVRSTVAAAGVVAVALAVAAVLLLFLLQRGLIASVDDAAAARAGEVASELADRGAAGLPDDLAATTRESQLIQVIDPRGAVVAASSVRADRKPLSPLRPRPGQMLHSEVGRLELLDNDAYLVVVTAAEYQGSVYTVVVVSSIQTERETVSTVLTYLMVGVPLLLLLVTASTWVLVGRALRPVEQIRSRVQGIGAGRLADRVPVPATRDEIARLAVTMNEMLDRLQTAQGNQRRFVADASHELRSPLATLTATLDVAVADPTGRAWSDLQEVLGAETSRMRRLVEDLLLLAKADDDGLRMQVSDVDLDDLLDAEARRLRASGDLVVETDIHPAQVRGDAAKLGQVVRNLADNARQQARRRVRIGLREHEGSAVVLIDDDGPGIPAADRGRVFERFVRLDESRARGSGGSGLGLSIVHEIVKGHGGRVTISDSPLGGARFEVRFSSKR
jgi:signal transduction histidine kinase